VPKHPEPVEAFVAQCEHGTSTGSGCLGTSTGSVRTGSGLCLKFFKKFNKQF
jgi:hypothetical protein